MDHSTSIIVIDAQGRAVAALPSPHQPAVMLRWSYSLRGYREELSLVRQHQPAMMTALSRSTAPP